MHKLQEIEREKSEEGVGVTLAIHGELCVAPYMGAHALFLPTCHHQDRTGTFAYGQRRSTRNHYAMRVYFKVVVIMSVQCTCMPVCERCAPTWFAMQMLSYPLVY